MRARIALASVLACFLTAGAGQAQAELTYDHSFGSAGSGSGQFADEGPYGVAVNNATGDVYVSDAGNQRIEQFDSEGNFIRMWGRGVNQSSGGDVCPRPGNPGDVCQAGSAGSARGWFSAPTGIAVDNSTGPAGGDVYVIDRLNSRVQRFTADGQFILMWGKGVNQGTGGNICTAGETCGAGGISGDAGTTPVTPSAPGVFAGWNNLRDSPYALNIAVDGSGYVYVGDFAVPVARVQKFNPDGTFLAQIAPGSEGAPNPGFFTVFGVAVDAQGTAIVDSDLSVKGFFPSDFSADGTSAYYDVFYGGVTYAALTGRNTVGQERPAVDPSNQFVFALGRSQDCGDTSQPDTVRAVFEYDPVTGFEVDCSVPSSPTLAAATPFTGTIASRAGGMAISLDHRLYAADTEKEKIHIFNTPVAAPPSVSGQSFSGVTSSKAVLGAGIAANLADTTYHVEYGTAPCSDIPNPCVSSAESTSIGRAIHKVPITTQVEGLSPATTYYYRLVATNEKGSNAGPDRTFATYAAPQIGDCANNLARQQTHAALLLDCRAYELVSASNQGGYDIESDLVAGQTHYAGYAAAKDRALYGVHNGVIPNSGGKPTNRGLDPYLATRDAGNERWNTTYVGIPADIGSSSPFSSALTEADGSLRSFAFGGADLCNPCFGDGSVGIPIHRPDGSLIQGMAGSLPVALPVPAGVVRKHFSGDGSRFVFGSKQQFEPAGNSSGTDVTVYARDLDAGTTEVVSTEETGDAIQNGDGVAELDMSSDGSRVLIGKKLGVDGAGNALYDLYLHLAGTPGSIHLTPGISSGVIYAGMSAEASMVYFTTHDSLAGAVGGDGDTTSADLFRADIEPATMSAPLVRVSRGESGSGDTDSCDPVGNSFNNQWNVISGEPRDCSAVAIGGGGGVAAETGAIYFLSPERLDTSGDTDPVQDAPNLYVARPGDEPKFVVTLESELNGAQPLAVIYHGLQTSFGSFAGSTGVAVDRANGYVYVLNTGAMAVRRFDTSGNPVNFTAGSGSGTNSLNGSDAPTGIFSPLLGVLPAQIAVDQSTGKLYVPDYNHNVVDIFNSDGSYAGQLSASTPSGVAIHPVTHDIYVARRTAGQISVFPAGGGAATSFSVSANSANPTGVAVDSAGTVYVVNTSKANVYDASGKFVKTLDPNPSNGVAVDPLTDDVFVNEKTKFVQFDASGAPTGGADGHGAPVGEGKLTNSIGIALDAEGNVFASNGTKVAVFPRSLLAGPLIDNPLLLHSLSSADRRYTGDFQTTSSGGRAVFTSTAPLSGADGGGHRHVFVYDALMGGKPTCISCNPTEKVAVRESGLASNGLSITDDGRVFFSSGEPLVLRDTNQKSDAYEWKDGRVELISSGQSPFDSGLLGVSADGKDAFFFTRETLVSGDANGSLMKLYDAREGGGFFIIPPAPQCAASDECHGVSSPAPPPPSIGTNAGSGGNRIKKPKPCPKGKRMVKRKGKVRCVRRKHHHRKNRAHKRGQRREHQAKQKGARR